MLPKHDQNIVNKAARRGDKKRGLNQSNKLWSKDRERGALYAYSDYEHLSVLYDYIDVSDSNVSKYYPYTVLSEDKPE